MKFVIPLINDSITLEDVSEKAGFIDGYFEDINRPWLENHVFLLYKLDVNTKEAVYRDIKFKKIKSLHSRKIIRIKHELYLLYIFCITSKEIKFLKDTGILVGGTDKINRIIYFWKLTDKFVDQLIYDKSPKVNNKNLTVPEEDYVPKIEDSFLLPDSGEEGIYKYQKRSLQIWKQKRAST